MKLVPELSNDKCSDLTGFRVGACEVLADLLDLDRDTLGAPRD